MPSGIGLELAIAAVLVAIIAVAYFVGRTRRQPPPPEAPAARPEPARPKTVEVDSRFPPPELVTEAPPEEELVEQAPPTVAVRPTLAERLTKARRFLADKLDEVLRRGRDEETWDDLEAVLVQADIGIEMAARITTDLRSRLDRAEAADASAIRAALREELIELFDSQAERTLVLAPEGVTVWLVVGVNGVGKTTTIGKLAHDATDRGRTVALAASDTFRAAADEQLEEWARRAEAEVVKHQPGADPGAVAFDAYRHADARDIDLLIVDTAGRLHTKTPLMDELAKIKRVVEREGAVHEVLLVLDATAGQNGLVQAREFTKALGVTGIVLTKLDGTAKGGIAVAVENSLGIPIKLVGVGEGIEDLEPFDPKSFVDALLE
ncbi:MAG TPA: signal recognition particle-docking protein FtsY [Actinomycetota bacterium]|nr:signal recognition particle-docking protein FtsY [Actinomycetota bacterium]